MDLKTRYPLLTVCAGHGINEYLEKSGAEVFAADFDAADFDVWAEPAKSAAALKSGIEAVLEKTGAEKVNIMSFGIAGLAARAAASEPECAEKIASITTVCTPHRGLRAVNVLVLARSRRLCPAYYAYKNWLAVTYGHSTRLGDCVCDLTTGNMRVFEMRHPAAEGVFCQSAVCAANATDAGQLKSANNILAMYDGENDGFVSVYSAMWGQYCRVYRGISHMHVPPEVYADMVQSLIGQGL